MKALHSNTGQSSQEIGIKQTPQSILTPYAPDKFVQTRMGRVHISRVEVYLKEGASNEAFESWIRSMGWEVNSFLKPPLNVYSIDTKSTNEKQLVENMGVLKENVSVSSVVVVGGIGGK